MWIGQQPRIEFGAHVARGVKAQRPIGLSKPTSDWYRMFFDDHPMFWLDYYQDDKPPCFKTNRPEQAYRLNEQANCLSELVAELIPKQSVRTNHGRENLARSSSSSSS
jgi:hypothetical protein